MASKELEVAAALLTIHTLALHASAPQLARGWRPEHGPLTDPLRHALSLWTLLTAEADTDRLRHVERYKRILDSIESFPGSRCAS